MNRREFLNVVGTSASMRLAGAKQELPRDRDAVYPALVKVAERAVEESLPSQQRDGGALDEHEIPEPGDTADFVSKLGSVFLAPESRYHRNSDVLGRMERAAEYLVRIQHHDGTIDLPTTNFGSPPDTGFALEPLCAIAEILRARNYEETRRLETALETFIRQAACRSDCGLVSSPQGGCRCRADSAISYWGWLLWRPGSFSGRMLRRIGLAATGPFTTSADRAALFRTGRG